MKAWRFAIDENGGNASYHEIKARRVAPEGWRALGDLSNVVGACRKALEQHLQRLGDVAYAGEPWWQGYQGYLGHRAHIGRIFDNLLNKIQPGDLVVAHVGITVAGVAQISPASCYAFQGGYEYAQCLTDIDWVDVQQLNWVPDTCRFLGIVQMQSQQARELFAAWVRFQKGLSAV